MSRREVRALAAGSTVFALAFAGLAGCSDDDFDVLGTPHLLTFQAA